MGLDTASQQWIEDCLHWWRKVLTGRYAHWCMDWDALPVDETCGEITACHCFSVDGPDEVLEKIKDEWRAKQNEM